ncbi:MAG TPA: hypothetical protein VF870_03305 [Ignavibacteriaceae bacterium]
MYTHKNIIHSSLLILFLLIAGCATSYAPDNWLPETDKVPQNNYGGWITVIVNESKDETEDIVLQYGGEFIAEDSLNVYLLYDSLYTISKDKIENSIIELDQKNTGSYAAWVAGGSLLTLSNGYYAAITFPLWMVAGIPATSGESFRDRYEADYPDEFYWDNVKIFSRFPQGIDGINLSELRPLIYNK